jgi:uncharacterized protein (DUF1684 family)
MRSLRSFSAGVLLLILLAAAGVAAPCMAQDSSWQHEVLAWRAQHVADLQKPDGWLSLAGLEWLELGDNSFGSAPDNKLHLPASGPAHLGVLHLDGTTVTLAPPAGGFPQGFLIDGKPPEAQELHVSAETDKGNPHMAIGTLNAYVVRRADRFALRIKDAKSSALVGFHGLKWYDPDAGFRVTAHWKPYNPPKKITLVTLIDTTYEQTVPGAADFTLDGKTYSLEPVVQDDPAKKLFFILRDTTSATTTYGACRFLYTGAPSNGLDKAGELVLDFNHLENPPCAYTPYATCPLPPPGNRLSVPLPVGEQRYHD